METVNITECLDENDYPTEAALTQIKQWPIRGPNDCCALLDFVREIWKYTNFGYWTEANIFDQKGKLIRRYVLATGGWSGNESLVDSMRVNLMFWSLAWMQSSRGGGFIFEIEIDNKYIE